MTEYCAYKFNTFKEHRQGVPARAGSSLGSALGSALGPMLIIELLPLPPKENFPTQS